MKNQIKQKESFKVFQDEEGNYYASKPEDVTVKEVELAVKLPDYNTKQKAENFYSQKFREHVDAGCFIHDELNRIVRERKIWSDEQEKEYRELMINIANNEIKLRKGKIRFSEMEKTAKENLRLRAQLINLLVNRNAVEQQTAEFKAQQNQFNWLTAHCTFDDKGNRFFKDYDDFCKQDEAQNPIVNMAGNLLFKLMSGNNDDYRKDWPEFKLLRKYNLIDEKLRFVKNGQLVDEDGKPVNEKGQWIDKDGNPVDFEGKPLGDPLGEMEDAEFLPDENEPDVILENQPQVSV